MSSVSTVRRTPWGRSTDAPTARKRPSIAGLGRWVAPKPGGITRVQALGPRLVGRSALRRAVGPLPKRVAGLLATLVLWTGCPSVVDSGAPEPEVAGLRVIAPTEIIELEPGASSQIVVQVLDVDGGGRNGAALLFQSVDADLIRIATDDGPATEAERRSAVGDAAGVRGHGLAQVTIQLDGDAEVGRVGLVVVGLKGGGSAPSHGDTDDAADGGDAEGDTSLWGVARFRVKARAEPSQTDTSDTNDTNDGGE